MAKHTAPKTAAPEHASGSLHSYTLGFIMSILLTLAAYFLVVNHLLNGWGLVAAIMVLAMVQLLVQLIFFLHLSEESKPRWNLTVMAFMLIVLCVVVFGSLWIMHNLNYHAMTPTETDSFILRDEGIQR